MHILTFRNKNLSIPKFGRRLFIRSSSHHWKRKLLPRLGLCGLAVMLSSATVEGKNKAIEQGEKFEPERTQVTSAHLPELNDQSSLSDYLAYAALKNPGLEASYNLWQAALQKVPQAKSLPNPKLSYGVFIREVETRVGPQEQKFGLSQSFPWFGKLRLRGDVAAEAANAAYQKYQSKKLRLFYEVKNTYYEYYYLDRAIAITDDNINLLKHLESVAQAKSKAGAPLSGVIQAQVELGKLDDRSRTLNALRGPIVSRINAILNRPFDAPLPWPRTAPFREVVLSEAQLFSWLRELSPELKTLDHAITKEEKAIELAKKDFYPDFMLGVDYVDTGSALNPTTPGSGKDPVSAVFAVNLPIWRGKYKAELEEAKQRHNAALNSRINQENLLETDLKMALYRYNDAKRKIDLFRDTLTPEAEQSLNITEEAYRAGDVDFLNLIDAQRLLLEFQLSAERALTNREQSLAEIEMLVGRSVSP